MKKAKKYFELSDMSDALQYGSLDSDRRIQVKMPSAVVDALDELYPNIDRSKILTQLALEAILTRKKFQDRKILQQLVDSEQEDWDTMLDYLEERERE